MRPTNGVQIEEVAPAHNRPESQSIPGCFSADLTHCKAFSARCSKSSRRGGGGVGGDSSTGVCVLNDCWMIYQVASGSSVGRRTPAECRERILRLGSSRRVECVGGSAEDVTEQNGTQQQVRAACSMTEQGGGGGGVAKDAETSHRQTETPDLSVHLLFTFGVNNILGFIQSTTSRREYFSF